MALIYLLQSLYLQGFKIICSDEGLVLETLAIEKLRATIALVPFRVKFSSTVEPRYLELSRVSRNSSR